ncbi:glycosyltransferase [Paenibacillus riograndensis]|uniref:Glycosyltransferase 2-like domain-containing protein n=1 Tax=Paenibacillus riograndensis SBR5 TaxID=1073571 RepID=A0A0E4HFD7_9BACL|nr:glycosyltransferase [Paenibacillus riograndensis]CQR58612.1 hypothetical protein PRIO_6265 [Paenibacillus riograndensis SBR5]
MCKVSVIVPVYNGEKYLKECMQSILNQSLFDIEVICINDGSNDATAEILDSYAKKDLRVKVVHKENSGYGKSVNIGFDMAQGEYIGVVEADDYIDVNMYLHLYEQAKIKGADFVKADFHKFYGDGSSRKFIMHPLFERKSDKDMYNKLVNYEEDIRVLNNYVVTWAGIYKRKFIKQNCICHNETPGASYQDNGFWYQVMINSQKALFLNTPYYFVRRDNESSSVYNPQKIFCTNDEYEFIRSYIRNHGKNTDILLQFQWEMLFKIHENDMMRISKEFYQIFAKRFRNEFLTAIEQKEFDADKLSRAEQIRLNVLLENSESYIEKYFLFGNNSIKQIEGAENIAIYGGGWNGRRILSIIRNYGYLEKLSGIVVSDLKGKEEVIDRICLKEIQDIDFESNTLFILATQEKYQADIMKKMVERGYTNWMRIQDITL